MPNTCVTDCCHAAFLDGITRRRMIWLRPNTDASDFLRLHKREMPALASPGKSFLDTSLTPKGNHSKLWRRVEQDRRLLPLEMSDNLHDPASNDFSSSQFSGWLGSGTPQSKGTSTISRSLGSCPKALVMEYRGLPLCRRLSPPVESNFPPANCRRGALALSLQDIVPTFSQSWQAQQMFCVSSNNPYSPKFARICLRVKIIRPCLAQQRSDRQRAAKSSPAPVNAWLVFSRQPVPVGAVPPGTKTLTLPDLRSRVSRRSAQEKQGLCCPGDGDVGQLLVLDHRRDALQVLIGGGADTPAARAVGLAGDDEVMGFAARGFDA